VNPATAARVSQIAIPDANITKVWGGPEYAPCQQPYSWHEIVHGYMGNKFTVKAGGLGTLFESGGYQTWMCIKDHFCGDPWFCWVYHETNKIFTPWGTNSKLRLIQVDR